MKIVFDTDKNTVKVGSKTFGADMPLEKQNTIISHMRKFVKDNTKITDFNGYEEDSMWMSYRYCIGRHTIASHMRARDIAVNCYKRMSDERSMFTAYDINREIEDKMKFGYVEWHFPITSFNAIYTSAIDIFCQFIEDYNIKTKEEYLKYYCVDVILSDNERGYKLETTTWEEKLTTLIPIFIELYGISTVDEIIECIKKLQKNNVDDIDSRIRWVVRIYPNADYFTLNDIEDLFIWNDLLHLFDIEHHHMSILKDGSKCEWFWTYTNDTEQREDGYYYNKEIGYKKIRVPVNSACCTCKTWIPDDSIKENLY